MAAGSRPALTASSSISGQLSRAQPGAGARPASLSMSTPINLPRPCRALRPVPPRVGTSPASSTPPCKGGARGGSAPRRLDAAEGLSCFKRSLAGIEPARSPPTPFPSLAGRGVLALEKLGQGAAQLRWARGDANSSRLHRRDLVLGAALAAGDDGAGMAHAATGRGGAAGDEADGGLAPPLLPFVGEE